ncbi:MAG: hypothetical protein FLDDKLPJ_02202 [Phycisphaerae bacterium]|nr:hypothetical protein [Phycisphaerae bacterium]
MQTEAQSRVRETKHRTLCSPRGATCVALLLTCSSTALAQCYVEESQKLVGHMRNDDFGQASVIDGDILAVGSPEGGAGPGRVEIYRRSQGIWTRVQTVTADDAAFDDRFGSSVELKAGLLTVAAPTDDNDRGADAGAVYVFRYDGNAFTQEAKLIGSATGAGHRFGSGVEIAADQVLVLSESENLVYGFAHNGDAWGEIARIPTGAANTSRIAADRNVLLVYAANTREVTIYRFDPPNWLPFQVVSTGLLSEIDLRGEDAVFAYGPFSDDAAAVVYQDVHGAFLEQARIPVTAEHQGFDAAIDGDHLVLTVGHFLDRQILYLYRRDRGTWSFVSKLVRSDMPVADPFISVALDADTAVLGIPADAQIGQAYVFDGLGAVEADCDPCTLIRTLQTRCRDGKLRVKIKSDLHHDERLHLDLGGEVFTMAFNERGTGKLKRNRQSGMIDVSVLECPGLNGTVDCGT